MSACTEARTAALLVLIAGFTPAIPAAASSADYVYTPIVIAGEREVDFKSGFARARAGAPFDATSLGFGYGAEERWFTEVYAKWNRENPDPWRFDAVEWENRLQLTETGEYAVDSGLVVELERPQNRQEGWELRLGPLFQADLTPRIQANLNLLAERRFRAVNSSAWQPAYQFQVKYRWRPALEWGIQGFGTLGPGPAWATGSEQIHNVGPALFGRVKVGARSAISYNAAWLIGSDSTTPRSSLRLQAEYEF